MTHELPPNPLGGLASDIDLAVAVSGADGARRRICAALERDGLRVTAQARSADDLRAASLRAWPHVAVLASRGHPGTSVRSVRRSLPRTRVIVVLTHDRPEDVRGAVDAGADAVVLETRVASTLPVTVRAVCAGQACVPRELRRQFERPALSVRERQVVALAAAGSTNAEIADRLFLAESTVKGHLASAFGKLGVHSREEAAALVHDPDTDLGIPLPALTASTNGSSR